MKASNGVFCHKTLNGLRHLDHAPALLSPDHKSVEGREILPEQLPEVARSIFHPPTDLLELKRFGVSIPNWR
jgi:hypothetical protein